MIKELQPLPYSTIIIHRLLTNNLDSPVLAEIQRISFTNLDTNQMTTLLPALAKMTSLVSLALPHCDLSSGHFRLLFTKCPALSKLQSLDLSYVTGLQSEELHLLSQSTTFTNLTSLNLMFCLFATNSRAFTSSQSGPATTTSRWDGDDEDDEADEDYEADYLQDWKPTLDSSGLIALFSSPVVKNLTHLNFGDIEIVDPLIHATIATSPFLSNLVSLNLSWNRMCSQSIAALAASSTLTKLTHLNLPLNDLGDQLIAQLFSPPSLLGSKLQSLNLRNTKITVASLEVVLKACPHLTELNIAVNKMLGREGISFVATRMPNLTKLNLAICDLSAQDCATLAASTTLTNLRELDLSDNNLIGKESAVALVTSPGMANLTHLSLGCTRSGPEALIAIAQSPSMSKLQHLDFSRNQVGDEGIIALAQSTTMKSLTWLDLHSNGIGPAGVAALCTSPVVSKLTSLRLDYNRASSNSIASVLAAPSSTLYSLLDLFLWEMGLNDEAVLQLLATPNLDQLNTLDITAQFSGIKKSTKAVYIARFDGEV
jgi:hypothetical protein